MLRLYENTIKLAKSNKTCWGDESRKTIKTCKKYIRHAGEMSRTRVLELHCWNIELRDLTVPTFVVELF